MAQGFVSAENGAFLLDGQKIILRGFGLGSWMNIEHFMIGMPGTEAMMRAAFAEVYGPEKAREWFERLLGVFLTEEDCVFLQGLGVNCLRLPFNYRHFEEDGHPGEFKSEGFQPLDRVIELCRRHGIKVILDLHTVPGGQNPDWHADNETGVTQFWRDAGHRKRVIDLWSRIASKYRNDTAVIGYDIVNEPCLVDDVDGFNDFFAQVGDEIRKKDPNHLIFLEGDDWAKDFTLFRMLGGPQEALSFHFYPGQHVSMDQESGARKTAMREYIKRFTDIRDSTGMPLWCGETGSIFSRDRILAQKRLVQDCLDVFEEQGISWTIWSYKDAQSLGLVYPRTDSAWMEMAKHFRSTGGLGADRKIMTKIFDMLGKDHLDGPIPEPLRYKAGFRILALLNYLRVEQELKPFLKKTPWEKIRTWHDGLLFKNCSYWEEIADLVKQYTRKT
jgi:hypothetical protein